MLHLCVAKSKCLLLEAAQSLSCQPELRLAVPFALGDAIAQCLEAKRAGNRRAAYLKSLSRYLVRFAEGRESLPVASVTVELVESWLNQFPKPASRQTWLNRLSTLFSFSVRRGHCASNPCDMIERVTVDRRAPKILSPDEADLLLRIVPGVCRAGLVLGVFAGIRPDELFRLNWDDIDLETKTVTVNDAKTRRRRIVPLEARPLALLLACPLKSGPVSPSNSTVRRFKRTAREALGLESFPLDLFRHTAASYLLALHGDAGKVATMLGNSSAVLLSHYHEPVKKEDCDRFWSLK